MRNRMVVGGGGPGRWARWGVVVGAAIVWGGLAGCKRQGFPEAPEGYREYAYVANSGAGTISVLDLVGVRAERTLVVGGAPRALAVNAVRNEMYAVNSQTGSVSVVDADAVRVVGTIGVGRSPDSIVVEAAGHRAFAGNAASHTISVLDLDARQQTGEVPTPGQPGSLQLSPDGMSLLVPFHEAGEIGIYAVTRGWNGLSLRAKIAGCPGAGSIAVLPDSSKAFVACSGGHQVMAIGLAAASGSWAAKQDAGMMKDRMLAMLDVGMNPTHLALKPDGGEIFVSNTAAGSVSEIATQTNEVGATTMIGTRPAAGIISRDSTLYVANSGDDAIGLYSIDDGKLVSSLHTGSGPGTMVFSADEHLLLALDTRSGDVSVVRTQGRLGPNLFTILPAGSGPAAIVTMVVKGRGKA